MRQFLVRYDSRLIGVLYINEKGEYKYICNQDMLKGIPTMEPVAPALSASQPEFGYVIPYFKVRLDNIEGPIARREYGFVTDKVRLIEV
ncbi:MAG: hypothetical protein IKR04_02465 [Clostridia bacterium]|nr:hypothetical protein [Clostridia bacterium]